MSTTMKFLFLFVACFVLAAYATDHEVKVGNLKFDPQTLDAEKGDIIVFTWLSDGSQHDVVQSDDKGSCDASTKITNAFKTQIQSSGTWNYTITEAPNSKIWYFCSVGNHCSSGMYGTINVVDGDAPSTAPATGTTGSASGAPAATSGGSDSTSTSAPNSAVSFNSITSVTLLVFVSSLIMAASLL